MKPYLLIVLFLLWSLGACQTANRQPQVGTSPTVLPVATDTPSRSSPAATATTEVITPPIPTATPLPVVSLTEKGVLLLWDDRAKQYLVLDLSTGAAPQTVHWNSECGWGELLPYATTAVCTYASGQEYLFDVLENSKQDLPIWDADLIGWSPNGRFLAYTQGPEDMEDVFSYDLTTNVTHTLASGIDRRERAQWFTQPLLSADGQSVVIVRATLDNTSVSVFEMVAEGSELRKVGLDAPPATWDLAWSPVASQFVYGATDIEQEIGPTPNYLYIVDMQTGEIRELAKSPYPLFFGSWSLEWSPTGKQIAVGLSHPASKSEPQGCMIDVDTDSQICLPASRSVNGRFLAWSPSGKHIAFVDTARNLVVSNPDGTDAVKLLENVPKDFLLFWR